MTVFIANKSMDVAKAARLITANGGKMLFPKGIDESGYLVRFVARDHAGNDKVWGACQNEEFAKINERLVA